MPKLLWKILIAHGTMSVGLWGAMISFVCMLATADPWYFWAMVASTLVGVLGFTLALSWDVG